jgi:hypothetical protein
VTPFRRFRPLYPSELPGHTWRGRDSNPHVSRVKAGRLYLFVHRASRVPAWVRTRDLRRVGTVLSPLSYRNGSGDGIRTRDVRLMRPARTTELLHPAVRRAGFEPATCRLRGGSSTAELTARGGGGRGRTATGNAPTVFETATGANCRLAPPQCGHSGRDRRPLRLVGSVRFELTSSRSRSERADQTAP